MICVQVEGRIVSRNRYAVCVLLCMRWERWVFENMAENFPQRYVPAIQKGCRKAVGADTKYRIVLLDGHWHANNSSEAAFEEAAIQAVTDAKLAIEEAQT